MVFFGKMQKIKEYEMTGLLAEFKQDDYKALPAQSSQQIVKLLYKNWKSFWESKREYEKHPEKFTGRPRPPKYKDKTGYGICIFTNQTGQARLKDGFIYFPKKTGIQPVQTKVEKFAQVRIIPQASCFVVEVVYEKQEVKNENLKQENFLTLDLGLNNFATSANNVGLRPFIINGRVLKSVNQMYNKTTAKLQSYIGNRGTSNRINKNITYNHFSNCRWSYSYTSYYRRIFT